MDKHRLYAEIQRALYIAAWVIPYHKTFIGSARHIICQLKYLAARLVVPHLRGHDIAVKATVKAKVVTYIRQLGEVVGHHIMAIPPLSQPRQCIKRVGIDAEVAPLQYCTAEQGQQPLRVPVGQPHRLVHVTDMLQSKLPPFLARDTGEVLVGGVPRKAVCHWRTYLLQCDLVVLGIKLQGFQQRAAPKVVGIHQSTVKIPEYRLVYCYQPLFIIVIIIAQNAENVCKKKGRTLMYIPFFVSLLAAYPYIFLRLCR